MPKKQVAVTLRKPQAPADLDTFVTGQKDAASGRVVAPANPLEVASVVEHGARNFREMTLYLPTEVVRELSFYCMDRNCDVNRVVAEAVSKHVVPETPQPAASIPNNSWVDTLEVLVERSRLTLGTLWALRPWSV